MVLEEPTPAVRGATRRIWESTTEPAAAIVAMLESHFRLILLQRPPNSLTFTKNKHALPEHDLRRVGREMTLYAEERVSVVIPLRPDLSEPEARLLT